MYSPKHFEELRPEVLHGMIRSCPLAALVTLGTDGLVVNHLPFLLDTAAGEFGTLRGHMARANPMCRQFSDRLESIVIFQGTNAYISPNWYPGKRDQGKAVPTWNYAVVHAHGFPRIVEDGAWLLQNVSEMSDAQEALQRVPWKVADAPGEYIDGLLKAIVGIEIPIAKLVGKWKVSQNRPAADRQGVIDGLEARNDPQSLAMAALVRQAMSE
jgi:transcriptional regulator